jgi:hypothetical protein
MSLDLNQQELVDRISAMSAEQFNACLATCIEDQEAFNEWSAYAEETNFYIKNPDPLPNADTLLDVVDAKTLNCIRSEIRIARKKAKRAGQVIDEESIRETIFTEAFYELGRAHLLSTHNVTTAMYDDIAAMDEEVHEDNLSWTLIQGDGKDLALADYMSRHG